MFSSVSTDIRVRYAHIDRMGVVYHSHYAEYMEAGRTEWLRQRGFSYRELEKCGFQLPLVDLSISFRSPARYDDLIRVSTFPEKFSRKMVVFQYEIFRNEELLVTGSTRHLFVSAGDLKPCTLPEEFFSRLSGDLSV